MSFLDRIDKNYGKNIPAVAWNLLTQSVRERRFLIAAIYFMIIPAFLVTIAPEATVLRGDGISTFYAHTTSFTYILSFYLSFFLGQILVVVLSADQIAGEIELDTYPLLRSKPVYESEIVIGKFIGLVGVIFLLDTPGFLYIYIFNLIRYGAHFPSTYWHTFDELVAALVILVLLHALLVAVTLFFSALFNKNLYAILSSLVFIFILSSFSNSIQGDSTETVPNYISIDWISRAVLPDILYHIDPLKKTPGALAIISGIVGVIVVLLGLTTLTMNMKEIQ